MRVRYDEEAMATAKYLELLQNVVAENEMWMLMKDDALSVTYVGRVKCLPIWSTKEGAEANLEDEWKDFRVKSMSVEAFITLILPDFINDDVLLEMNEEKGFRKSVRSFEMDLRAEAKKQGFDIETACREIEEVMDSMEAEEYYEELLGEVISEGGIWTLSNDDGGFVMADTDEGEVIPIWNSHDKAAGMCCEEWKECSPEFVSVISCLEELLPLLDYDEIKLLLVTNDEMGGIMLSAEDFAIDLENAIDIRGYDIDEAPKHQKKAKEKDNVVPFPRLS